MRFKQAHKFVLHTNHQISCSGSAFKLILDKFDIIYLLLVSVLPLFFVVVLQPVFSSPLLFQVLMLQPKINKTIKLTKKRSTVPNKPLKKQML